jgi:hypothetical protein
MSKPTRGYRTWGTDEEESLRQGVRKHGAAGRAVLPAHLGA